MSRQARESKTAAVDSALPVATGAQLAQGLLIAVLLVIRLGRAIN